ncbi:hypothetical protein KEJ18_02550 [Candidatus Bathyarchaeota archaeon]|nr:hypothetical protein [Candidatus Bathyarchaeota archaeon]
MKNQTWYRVDAAMFEVLCYGDSNTCGADPQTGGRFSIDERWPGVLQKALGEDYHVIEEGLGGRTTVWDDPVEGHHKNGAKYLIPCLEAVSSIYELTVTTCSTTSP